MKMQLRNAILVPNIFANLNFSPNFYSNCWQHWCIWHALHIFSLQSMYMSWMASGFHCFHFMLRASMRAQQSAIPFWWCTIWCYCLLDVLALLHLNSFWKLSSSARWFSENWLQWTPNKSTRICKMKSWSIQCTVWKMSFWCIRKWLSEFLFIHFWKTWIGYESISCWKSNCVSASFHSIPTYFVDIWHVSMKLRSMWFLSTCQLHSLDRLFAFMLFCW